MSEPPLTLSITSLQQSVYEYLKPLFINPNKKDLLLLPASLLKSIYYANCFLFSK